MTFILCLFFIQDSLVLPKTYNHFDREFSLFELDSNNILYLEQRSYTIYLIQMDKQIITEFYRDKNLILDFFMDPSYRIILFYEKKIKLMDKNLILLTENMLEYNFSNIQLLHVLQNKIYFLNRLNNTLNELDIQRIKTQELYSFNDRFQTMIADQTNIQLIFRKNTYIFNYFFSLKTVIKTDQQYPFNIQQNQFLEYSLIIYSKRLRFHTYFINEKLRLYREK